MDIATAVAPQPVPAPPPAPPQPSTLEIEVYKSLATLFNSEETSFWTRNNILVVVQGGLIAATASIVGNADKALGAHASPRIAMLWFVALCVLSAVGLMTAVAWAFMVGRSQRIADVILAELKNLELELARNGVLRGEHFQAYNVFSKELRRADGTDVNRLNSTRLSKVWATLGGALAAVWLVLLGGFLVALATGGAASTAPAQDDALAAAVQQSAQATAAAGAAAAAAQAAAIAAQAAAQAAQWAASASATRASPAATAPAPKSAAPARRAPARRP